MHGVASGVNSILLIGLRDSVIFMFFWLKIVKEGRKCVCFCWVDGGGVRDHGLNTEGHTWV